MKKLEIKDLNIKFNGGSDFTLDISNITISNGDYISVIGPNGSGKSTLLKTIAGLITRYSGSIKINNEDLKNLKKKEIAKKIAYVPQFNSGMSFFNFTVFEYILTGRFPYINKLAGYTKKDREIVRGIISYLNIEKYKDRMMKTLSGGELQKASIGAALAQQSDILLFDEVNAFLDYKHKIELEEILSRLIKRGETIISVTHNINDSLLDSGKILALKSGELAYYGTLEDFIKNNGLEKVYGVPFIKMRIEKLGKDIFLPYKNEN